MGHAESLLSPTCFMDGLHRASGRSRKKKSNFAGFSGTNSPKKRPISCKLPEQISLEGDWFCADLRKVFNATRRSYSTY